jgi:hypothetical protein
MVNVRVFVLFSLGFFVSYLFRGVNLALAPDLAATLSLTASDLGLLCYATPEMEQVLTEAGFRDVRFTPSPVGSRSLITASKPPRT